LSGAGQMGVGSSASRERPSPNTSRLVDRCPHRGNSHLIECEITQQPLGSGPAAVSMMTLLRSWPVSCASREERGAGLKDVRCC
jgi:hypothetical protein